MSVQRGLTTWVVKMGGVAVGYRWNMPLRRCLTTFNVVRGQRTTVACGPLLMEW